MDLHCKGQPSIVTFNAFTRSERCLHDTSRLRVRAFCMLREIRIEQHETDAIFTKRANSISIVLKFDSLERDGWKKCTDAGKDRQLT